MSKKDALIQPDRGQSATSIHLVTKDRFEDWLKPLSAGQRAAIKAQKFEGKPAQVAIVPDGDEWFAAGGIAKAEELTSWCLAKLAEDLPEGTYRLADGDPGAALHGWQTAQYKFTRYLKPDENTQGPRVLLSPKAKHLDDAIAEADAEMLVRDLVNTPAEDMGPAQLEAECEKLAKAYDAKLKVVKGDALEKDYPMVHAVGRAAARHHAPRLLRLEWGDEKHPKLAIVGKGVCFDSGGLDVKSAVGMKLMKKDMGGAAHAIALAGLVMNAKLPVRLHLLIPAVENAIAGNAFRPGDVLNTRKGLTVEIGNTDAEGRLVLADGLILADESNAPVIIDAATLTGAACVAVGDHYNAMFSMDDGLVNTFQGISQNEHDPLWRLPLEPFHQDNCPSDYATTANSKPIPGGGVGCASNAAGFLSRFVDYQSKQWIHFDLAACYRDSGNSYFSAGATGRGVRSIARYLCDL